ncbi:MAG: N-6 DNA methylase [Microcystis aeruginosa BS13-10]|jgi:type I restriction enzyme M protein|uniref:N-6 DNA methylase n=1 Tax=Microcystis aeruginosa G11-04 TaxID=2685956 RepID=A0A966FYZ8_MICAE|nr:N-6 DNA methylase [Microcystis aeruginosa BS13-10]NCS57372.1 N-6 DNA methylase [Microcystis aeruginosa G11-04]NCT43254.1 N-6 DNA methylase [Microcystis aeruginosa G11-09]
MSKLLATLPDGKVCDFIDQKIRNDTPEEYVRQNIERRLVLELGYLPEQIEVEYPIKQGSKTVRVDLAIFREGDQHNQENIWIVIECKKDSVTPSASKDGIEQLRSYMAACDNSEWGMWTNGRKKTVLRRIRTKEGIEYEEPNDIPSKNGNVEEVDRPTRDALKNAVGDNLLFSFKICHDHIYVTDGLQKQPAFFELLKVIFCKIHDERNFPNPLEFYATAKEKKSNDGRLTVFNRISKIFSAVKKQYPAIFDANDEIKLQPRSLAYIIGELQRYSFLSTNIDVKGKAYEELVGANLRGDRGEFFTPRNVQKMTIRMLEPKVTDKILDQSCGTGGFLVIAMNEVIKKLKLQAGVTEQSDPWMQNALNSKIQETAKANFFGIDINPDLVKATKMNMVMNNDGSGNILRQDSLLHPHQWEDSFRKQFAKALDIDPKTLRSEKDLGHFDLIATNPPFGSKLPIKDEETLKQYQLAHVWKETESGWEPTEQLQGSASPEILFIERCWQFLKPEGRMGIVLPDAILGAPGLLYVRYWLIKHCRIVASIDLHPDTFQPRNGTQTSVLILQKKTEKEIDQGTMSDYEIFMAQVKAIGHDKRGNITYRRNEEGEEILVPTNPESIPLIERTATGEGVARPLPRQKVEDDDTDLVANEFIEWKKKVVLGW